MDPVEHSDARAVSRRILTLPRVTAVVAVVLLVSATISLAADKPAAMEKPASHSHAAQKVMVVPDVRDQMFVFASGTLEDAGFGWKVRGSVQGYPADMVTSQSPRPGAQVLDTGAPTITLHLVRGKSPELGQPQDRSPYGASLIRRPAKHSDSH
jgi:beta-lactam-binding protein with PASTA domain